MSERAQAMPEVAWDRALDGWTVVITRPAHQSDALARALQVRGADVVAMPTITIESPQDGGEQLRAAAKRLALFDWVVFTSENAVARFAHEVGDRGAFTSVRVAAIGEGTALALSSLDIAVDLVPARFVAESLVAAFPPAEPGGRILLPRAAVARDVVPHGLRELGWQVEVVAAYETRPAHLEPDLVSRASDAQAITFTSSSTVLGYLANAGPADLPPVVASIGPVTSATARASGVDVTLEATIHTSSGLAESLADFAAEQGRPRVTP